MLSRVIRAFCLKPHIDLRLSVKQLKALAPLGDSRPHAPGWRLRLSSLQHRRGPVLISGWDRYRNWAVRCAVLASACAFLFCVGPVSKAIDSASSTLKGLPTSFIGLSDRVCGTSSLVLLPRCSGSLCSVTGWLEPKDQCWLPTVLVACYRFLTSTR